MSKDTVCPMQKHTSYSASQTQCLSIDAEKAISQHKCIIANRKLQQLVLIPKQTNKKKNKGPVCDLRIALLCFGTARFPSQLKQLIFLGSNDLSKMANVA